VSKKSAVDKIEPEAKPKR